MLQTPLSEEPSINLLDPRSTLPPPAPPQKRANRIYIAVVIFLIVCIVGLAGYWYYSEAAWARNPAHGSKTLQADKPWFLTTVKNFIFSPSNVVTGQEEDRINILLLGIGGSGHDGAYLSDTNIILSIKPSTNQVAMISIPRDLSVKINEYGYRKINDADAFGEAKDPGNGGEYARQIFEQTFGLSIPYYVRVNFQAFQDLVDSVGGVDVDVAKTFTDNEYPNGEKKLGPNCTGETESSPCRYLKAHFEAGLQHMDGRTALIYARSRHGNNGEGSDFARAHRQQQVIFALKEKFLSFGTYTNPTVVKKVIDSLSTNVKTNLDLSQIIYLGNFAKEVDKSTIKNLVLDTSPQSFLTQAVGSYALVPKTGNFSAINAAIQNIFLSTSTLTQTPAAAATTAPTIASAALQPAALQSAQIEIQNGTWLPGLAARAKKAVEDGGLTVNAFGNSPVRPVEHTIIYVLNPSANKQIIDNLAKICHTEATTELPDWLKKAVTDTSTNPNTPPPYRPTTDLLVILGTDYQP